MLSHVSNGALRASLNLRVPSSRSTCSTLLLCTTQQRSPASSARRRSSPQTTHHATRPTSRSFATVAETKLPKDIAVLGGGLTGLTTAYYLTRFHPDANITIYEADDRLGGWIDTEHVDVKTIDGKDATITFERGARTVAPQSGMPRWEDFVLFDMIDQLSLLDKPGARPYAIPKFDPVLSKRYIYYPDHLVEMPGPLPPDTTFVVWLGLMFRRIHTVLTEPAGKGVASAIWTFYMDKQPELREQSVELLEQSMEKTKPRSPLPKVAVADHADLSVGEFLYRMTGNSDVVDNLASAFFHGIWGGDIWKLSVRETSLQTFYLQQHYLGSVGNMVKEHDYESGRDLVARNPALLRVLDEYGVGCAYIGFHKGFSTLSDAVAHALKGNPKVTIKTGTPVLGIRHEKAEGEGKGKAVVESSTGTHKFDKVISSLYSGTLAKLTGDSLPALKKSTAVTIQIVNLWYPNPYLTVGTPGFGYLIPQSVPASENPHAALGVIFDSDRDRAASTDGPTEPLGTKLTVMLGGHYWDFLDPESWPDAKEAAAMAISTVHRQLGISTDEPVYTSTKVCRECIPQHLVGHRERMAQAHTELQNAFGGTLAVVGGSYTSPGVLPVLKAARDMALKVAGQGYKNEATGTESSMSHVGETGLGRFHGRNEMIAFLPTKALPFRGKMLEKAFDRQL